MQCCAFRGTRKESSRYNHVPNIASPKSDFRRETPKVIQTRSRKSDFRRETRTGGKGEDGGMTSRTDLTSFTAQTHNKSEGAVLTKVPQVLSRSLPSSLSLSLSRSLSFLFSLSLSLSLSHSLSPAVPLSRAGVVASDDSPPSPSLSPSLPPSLQPRKTPS